MKPGLWRDETVRRSLDRAEHALRAGLLDEAQRRVEQALRQEPGHAEARLLEARIALQKNHPRHALAALDAHDRYAGKPSRRLDVMLMRASSLAQVGQVGMAIALLDELADAAPGDTRVLQALAAMQLQDHRDDAAVETLTLLCDLDPSDGVSARTLSDLLSKRDPSAAVEALGKVDGSKRLRAARRCRDAGRWIEAEEHYAALLDEHGGETWLWVEAGELSLKMSETQRAVDRLKLALSLEERGDSHRRAWARLGEAWLHRGAVASAGYAWWRSARKGGDEAATAWAGLLSCAMLGGRGELMRRADRVLRGLTTRAQRRALMAALWPHAALALSTAAANGEAVADYPNTTEHGAVREKTRGPRSGEDDSPLRALLRDASADLAESVARFPGRADHRYHLARTLETQGQTDDALEQAAEALAINPAYQAAQQLAGRLAA